MGWVLRSLSWAVCFEPGRSEGRGAGEHPDNDRTSSTTPWCGTKDVHLTSLFSNGGAEDVHATSLFPAGGGKDVYAMTSNTILITF